MRQVASLIHKCVKLTNVPSPHYASRHCWLKNISEKWLLFPTLRDLNHVPVLFIVDWRFSSHLQTTNRTITAWFNRILDFIRINDVNISIEKIVKSKFEFEIFLLTKRLWNQNKTSSKNSWNSLEENCKRSFNQTRIRSCWFLGQCTVVRHQSLKHVVHSSTKNSFLNYFELLGLEEKILLNWYGTMKNRDR